ncbi:MAG: 8-oxoguanine DNA glycosylase [Halobacteriales archaeon]
MERDAIPTDRFPGGLDLQATLESGQTFGWVRDDGRAYEADRATGGDAWYATVVPASASPTGRRELVRARQADGQLEWESTTDAVSLLDRLLRLDDDLPAIRERTRSDALLDAAWDAYGGMRLVDDPPFRTLISFVCSAQMRVERIHEMQVALAREYGSPIEVDGRTYRAYPTPDQLATATEAELRDLGLGYRAPYVVETAEMVAGGEDPAAAADMPYEAAREWLTRFVGVGPKVADCVALFALGHLEAVPLDTWIRTAIADHYPDCDRDGYVATSRAIRNCLGGADGAFAGYAQTYLFHYLREQGG